MDAQRPAQYLRYTGIYNGLLNRRPLEELQKFLAPLRLPR